MSDEFVNGLLASLEPVLEPEVPFPHKMSQPQEEAMYGEKPAAKRGGRIAKFYRDEVNMIRADNRPISEIAESWQVSFDTILKVRQQGRFKSVPYIPRDEVDRRVNYKGERVQPIMSEFPTTPPTKMGRPFKTGRRDPVTPAERAAIAADPRYSGDVAKDYRLSKAYVDKIRREEGASHVRRGPLPNPVVEAIRIDLRTHEAIAAAYKVPVALVRYIKGERPVTPQSNNGGDDGEREDRAA